MHRCVNCGHEMQVTVTFARGEKQYGELLECPVCGETWLDQNAKPPRYEVVHDGVDEIGIHQVVVRRVEGG